MLCKEEPGRLYRVPVEGNDLVPTKFILLSTIERCYASCVAATPRATHTGLGFALFDSRTNTANASSRPTSWQKQQKIIFHSAKATIKAHNNAFQSICAGMISYAFGFDFATLHLVPRIVVIQIFIIDALDYFKHTLERLVRWRTLYIITLTHVIPATTILLNAMIMSEMYNETWACVYLPKGLLLHFTKRWIWSRVCRLLGVGESWVLMICLETQ